jgi:cell division protease FtsH
MKRLWIFIRINGLQLLLGFVIILILCLTVIGITVFVKMESFYKTLAIAQLPIAFITGIVYASTFVLLYHLVLRGGLAKLESGKVKSQQVGIKWADVIGMEEAKQEAWEVVELLKDRTKVQQIGGKAIRGILMIGPPGCGKTYLAKAIATEANVPFLSMSGSEFVEIFVGVGASKVRKLFKQARLLAHGYGACIVFIDELDAVARKRVFSVFGGTEETNSTQNQLLAEMDGLKAKEENVIVIGATNAAESNLDEALLRPGRFDRKIYIGRPNLTDRENIFKFYLSKVKYDDTIDIGRLARKAVHKSPADISNIIKEAVLIAARSKKDKVGMREIIEATERIEMGVKHRRQMTDQEREMTAYHESGHLMVLYKLHPTEDVFKASIISRGPALGMVHHTPKEELFTYNKERLMAEIQAALGGYAAEKIKFGSTSSGVAADFSKAMAYAHAMVWKFGMGDSGYMGDYSNIPESQLSEKVKERLNDDTMMIFNNCYKEVEELLVKDGPLLDRFAKELLAKEELDYDEIEAIFKDYYEKKT